MTRLTTSLATREALAATAKSKVRPHRPNFAANRFMPLLVTGILLSGRSLAQDDIQKQRQELVTALLTTDRSEKASQQRWSCINGNEPSRVKEMRDTGFQFIPDASDSCVAALQRVAKDHKLSDSYKRILKETSGDLALSETLPKAIGASTLSGDGKVFIGNGKAITATSAMAFDAGFTVAYTSLAPRKPGEPQKMKALAESCLAGEKDAGTCFSVGYVYGAQAVNAR